MVKLLLSVALVAGVFFTASEAQAHRRYYGYYGGYGCYGPPAYAVRYRAPVYAYRRAVVPVVPYYAPAYTPVYGGAYYAYPAYPAPVAVYPW